LSKFQFGLSGSGVCERRRQYQHFMTEKPVKARIRRQRVRDLSRMAELRQSVCAIQDCLIRGFCVDQASDLSRWPDIYAITLHFSTPTDLMVCVTDPLAGTGWDKSLDASAKALKRFVRDADAARC
jgi:hypothetical protein